MSNKNCKARSRQKSSKLRRKILRMRNFIQAVFVRKIQRSKQVHEIKGKTFIGRGKAQTVALDMHKLFPDGGGGSLFDHGHEMKLNQRQKRKRAKHLNTKQRNKKRLK